MFKFSKVVFVALPFSVLSLCLPSQSFAQSAKVAGGVASFEGLVQSALNKQSNIPAFKEVNIENLLQSEGCNVLARETTGVSAVTLGRQNETHTAHSPKSLYGSNVYASCPDGVLLTIASLRSGKVQVGGRSVFMGAGLPPVGMYRKNDGTGSIVDGVETRYRKFNASSSKPIHSCTFRNVETPNLSYRIVVYTKPEENNSDGNKIGEMCGKYRAELLAHDK